MSEALPNDPYAELYGELIGGMAPGALAISPTMLALRGVRGTVAPFTKAGASDRAAARVQELSADPGSAAEGIDTMSRSGLTPSQASGEEGLMELEKSVIETNRQLSAKYQAQGEKTNNEIIASLQEMPGEGSLLQGRELLQARREYLNELMDLRIANATDMAQQKAAALDPPMSRGEASIVIREELEAAYEAARRQEQQLWDAVPKDAVAPTAAIRAELEDVAGQNFKSTNPDHVPQWVYDLVGKPGSPNNAGEFNEFETLGEIQAFRSRVLEEARAERGGLTPSRSKLAVLDRLERAALLDMENAQGTDLFSPDVKETLGLARSFSKDLNETFRSGPVGRVFQVDKTGYQKTPQEMILQRLIGRSGLPGNEGVKSLSKATGDTPNSRLAMESYIQDMFLRRTMQNGVINPRSAQKFVRDNDE
ncbi:MAG: hypothetical protein MJA83_16965, partial [Gammaproteobacteria bacterium]|nr:hypothetical protein [Gammaproteobacteria bacterium]